MLKPDLPRFNNNPAPAAPSAASADSSKIATDPKQLAAARQFVAQVGGIGNARGALELLAILSTADQSSGGN